MKTGVWPSRFDFFLINVIKALFKIDHLKKESIKKINVTFLVPQWCTNGPGVVVALAVCGCSLYYKILACQKKLKELLALNFAQK